MRNDKEKRGTKPAGFTLIELLVVITIIAQVRICWSLTQPAE